MWIIKNCYECEYPFDECDLLELNGKYICTDCKPIYLQRMNEGVKKPRRAKAPSDDPNKHNGLAIASFVIGISCIILNTITCGMLSAIAIVGVVLGAVSLNSSEGKYAKNGLILNIVALSIPIVFAILYVIFMLVLAVGISAM